MLLCGEVFVRALDEATAFFGGGMIWNHNLTGELQTNRYAVLIAVDRCFSATRLV